VNYKISGELQLQLLDVLSEQPAGSPWRQLFERVVHRTNRFAATGASLRRARGMRMNLCRLAENSAITTFPFNNILALP
jgi:hypothetical protein